MKAIVQDQYGSPDVLKLAEVEKPVPSAWSAKKSPGFRHAIDLDQLH